MSPVPRQPATLHLDAKAVQDIMRQMQGDTKFQVFFNYVYEYRENALADLCNDAVVGETNKILAAIGEVRAYNAILALAGPPSAPGAE